MTRVRRLSLGGGGCWSAPLVGGQLERAAFAGGGSLVRCWVLRERAEGGDVSPCFVLVVLWGRLAAHTASVLVVLFGGLVVFVVGGGVVLVSFVV